MPFYAEISFAGGSVQVFFHNRAVRAAIFRWQMPPEPDADDEVLAALQRTFAFMQGSVER